MERQPNNPLHGVRLDTMIQTLLDYYEGWEGLAQVVRIKCFTINPSMKSSLTFLRKTPWARKEVEDLYIKIMR